MENVHEVSITECMNDLGFNQRFWEVWTFTLVEKKDNLVQECPVRRHFRD